MRAPFPYYGSKYEAAPLIEHLMGPIKNLVLPFAGSLGELLGRSEPAVVETVNDADGLLVNAWRAITYAPARVGMLVDHPVHEITLHAAQLLLAERAERLQDSSLLLGGSGGNPVGSGEDGVARRRREAFCPSASAQRWRAKARSPIAGTESVDRLGVRNSALAAADRSAAGGHSFRAKAMAWRVGSFGQQPCSCRAGLVVRPRGMVSTLDTTVSA